MSRSTTIRGRFVPPAEKHGARQLGLTAAATLWCLRGGAARGPDLLDALDRMGIVQSNECFYMSMARHVRRRWVSVEKVPSRCSEMGVQGAALENKYAILPAGRDVLGDFLAVVDCMVD